MNLVFVNLVFLNPVCLNLVFVNVVFLNLVFVNLVFLNLAFLNLAGEPKSDSGFGSRFWLQCRDRTDLTRVLLHVECQTRTLRLSS